MLQPVLSIIPIDYVNIVITKAVAENKEKHRVIVFLHLAVFYRIYYP